MHICFYELKPHAKRNSNSLKSELNTFKSKVMITAISRFIKLFLLVDSQQQTRFMKIPVHATVKMSSPIELFWLEQNKFSPTNLLIKLVHDALRPLQVQVFVLQRPVDVGELDAHLTHKQPVVLIGPVDARGRIVAHLGSTSTDRTSSKIRSN